MRLILNHLARQDIKPVIDLKDKLNKSARDYAHKMTGTDDIDNSNYLEDKYNEV